ncbi:MAG: hypothetical protein J6Y48_03360 [Clostridia bacterium]|nr:hypothetical protein [Clostridia bacterium]
MKYMHFKASCSYTALAAMMEYYGTETEDYRIALEMKLPWLFAKEDGACVCGPMLQGAKWFDLWLAPRGYRMAEEKIPRDKLCKALRGHIPAMIGIRTDFGKHAVVFTEYDGKYHFINPVREGSDEPARLSLEEAELLCRTGEEVTVGRVTAAEPEERKILPLLQASVPVIRENCAAIIAFAAEKNEPGDYEAVTDSLFRPLLLDGITMLELAGETALAREYADLQRQFLGFMRGDRRQALQETFSTDRLHDLTEQYACLIEGQIRKETQPRRQGSAERTEGLF